MLIVNKTSAALPTSSSTTQSDARTLEMMVAGKPVSMSSNVTTRTL